MIVCIYIYIYIYTCIRWAQASCEELLHRASFNISLSNLNGRFNRTNN